MDDDPFYARPTSLWGIERFALIVMAVLAIIAFALIVQPWEARGHEVITLDGKPLGFNWPAECCGGQDCSFIPRHAVQERPDGYHVTLRPGEHPMLKTKGYTAIIPYGRERTSPTGDYAICLSHEGRASLLLLCGRALRMTPRAEELWSYLTGLAPLGEPVHLVREWLAADLGMRNDRAVANWTKELECERAISRFGPRTYSVIRRPGEA